MFEYLRSLLNVFLVIFPGVAGLVTAVPLSAEAWTSATLEDVVTTVELAERGPSRVVTQVRFVVDGGKFHGFDLGELPGCILDTEESRAALDDGRLYSLEFRKLRSGRTRVLLGNRETVGRGGVNFAIVHTIDFVESGFIREIDGRARLDWTPPIWDEGLLSERVQISLPGPSADKPIVADPVVSKDYEVVTGAQQIELTKFRPVRWYAMRILVSFDASLVDGLEAEETVRPPAAAMGIEDDLRAGKSPVPPHIACMPVIVVLLGLLGLVFKGFHVCRVHRLCGVEHHFSLLSATSISVRFGLTLVAIGIGLGAQYAGSVAAGVPALAAAAALWISRRPEACLSLPAGGTWRRMDDDDVNRFGELTRDYRRLRRSILDISGVWGVVAFSVFLFGLGFSAHTARGEWMEISWIVVIDGLILAIPTWFSNVRAELPVDLAIESFACLAKMRRALGKTLLWTGKNTQTEFWVREDDGNLLEVRLRVADPPAGLHGIEIAGEALMSGSLYRTRAAVVLRAEPGAESARRVAASPHAVEHHLTPDLKEEIVVLRNRRGKPLGVRPLQGLSG